ncbi:MAG: hypothetical protein FJ146_10285 [Deltaproteobacteria bacterium]|nr:hypothetical protein [Deltaproteobacteria bacterium]
MKHTSMIIMSLALLATTVVGCMPKQRSHSSELANAHGGSKPKGYADRLVKTTYFGGNKDWRNGPGPGNFACMGLQGVNEWYIAPSDTFGDPEIWDGEECPANPATGIPECTRIMQDKKICGRKVKIKCGDNCRADAPEIVLMITDACPKNHKSNVGGACQGGPAFDIAQAAWERMHQRDDNISVYYQRVDDATPVGIVTQSSTKASENVDGEVASDGKFYPFCTNGSNTGGGFGWQPDLGGPNGGSCKVRGASTAPTPSVSGGSGNLVATIKVKSSWQDGYCADIVIENRGNATTNSWSLQLNTNGSKITQTWNLVGDTSGSNPTLKPSADWAAKISAGASTSGQGFCASRSGSEISVGSVNAN